MTRAFVDVRHASLDMKARKPGISSLLQRAAVQYSILRDVTFQLDHGQHVVLFGTSGAGKSSVLRMLTGVVSPSSGHVIVNGTPAYEQKKVLAPGYVSQAESEPSSDTVLEILSTFGGTHGIDGVSSAIGIITNSLEIEDILNRPASTLSTTEALKVNIARAALSQSPLILLDDTADELGAAYVSEISSKLFQGRTVIIATRSPAIAEELSLPMLLLHGGSLLHHGTCDEVAKELGCPRVIDVWVEGLKYNVLRALRKHPGVEEVRLVANDRFNGQHVRITVRSSRYMPAIYDLVSKSDLIRIEEVPATLHDILTKIS